VDDAIPIQRNLLALFASSRLRVNNMPPSTAERFFVAWNENACKPP
jgi:hypothetical protein